MGSIPTLHATFGWRFYLLRTKGRFSPGLITAVLFFWPLGTYTMLAAELSARVMAIAFAVGAALLAMPIGFILLKRNSYFDQTRSY